MPTDAAFCSAVRATLVGSMTPACTRSSYSPSISSATMSSGFPSRATCSKTGSRSFMLEIFFSWMRT